MGTATIKVIDSDQDIHWGRKTKIEGIEKVLSGNNVDISLEKIKEREDGSNSDKE